MLPEMGETGNVVAIGASGTVTGDGDEAVVTDVTRIAEGVKALWLLLSCPVKLFGNGELAAAKAWVGA